ncbi:Serine/threonine kinase family protein [Stigmatella aurantiaca DW4/3-1]|uniref:Serine/threonine kinase family protein n=2 Tax=Stigmatella aurantiaca TaxID=41 RepID=E3FXT2_STIAD|nr:Serine/threonine kinase family protein [Stigmatella aurantiaca DW4/3-1]
MPGPASLYAPRVSPPGTWQAAYEDELRFAMVEGILSRNEMEALRAEALRLQRSPLELLLERGQLSPQTLSSLRHRTEPQDTPPPAPASPFEAPLTQQPGGPPPSPSSEPPFPLPHWDRYQPVRFLGQGGMGQVFLAYDPRLRRNVALKFVRDGAPELAQRFLSEARAQARVLHERVCEMYEVGEVQGRAFIAMQYVNGRHLGQLAPELTLEQKLRVLRDVAEGVHAAHRAGLIHRDLKPSNILIERSEEGDLKAYVMDFGLARDWHAEHTATGDVLGTPHYMAPEQARGEGSALDLRVDVYSLGATLYHVLAGVPPFVADNALGLLQRIQSEEPRSLRERVPGLPVDLEAIVFKCLEKDREARYGSARALAEDLERFLSGEPVRARRAGAGYRLRKKLRKHWLVVGLGSTALLGLMLALAQALLTQREVALRERLARRFTERVERMEAQARYAALSPLHDTRPDRRALQEGMAALEEEIRQGGEPAQAPGNYALGRALLALGDPERALPRLESAWRGGYHDARVAYALALALGQLYQEQLLEVERLRDTGLRELRRQALEQRYRDPALGYLRQSEGADAPSPHYVAALLAFYEGRHAEALSELDAMRTTYPWFHEGPQLRGDIFQARAFRRRNQGDRSGALADIEAARQAYAEAARIGESEPAVHSALASLHLASLYLELYSQGEVQPPYERGVEALAHALTAAPDSFKVRVLESKFHRRLAEFRMQQGGEVLPLVEKALAAARAAQVLAPGESQPSLELAQVLRLWARYRQEHGEDPGEQLRQAVQSFERVPAASWDYGVQIELGHSFKIWADYEDQGGGDSLAHRDQAIAAYQVAIALDAKPVDGWVNLGTAYFKRASHPRAVDADADLERAREALERARGIDAGNYVPYYYGAQVHEWRARRRYNRGGAAAPELEKAIALYRQGLGINAKLPQFHNALGGALLWRSELAWEEGQDPFELLDVAQASFEQARDVAPKQGFAYNNLGEVHAWRGLYRSQRGEDPSESIRKALAFFREALERMPKQALFRANVAKAQHTLALWELRQGRDPGPRLEEAEASLRQEFELYPQLGFALRYAGEVQGVRARWRAQRGQGRGEDFERAAGFFRQAIERDPEWHEYRLALGRLHLAWAAWLAHTGQDRSAVLREGLARVEEALAARPHWAQALAARARLLLMLSETPAPVAQQEGWRSEARKVLEQALALNPHLGMAEEP